MTQNTMPAPSGASDATDVTGAGGTATVSPAPVEVLVRSREQAAVLAQDNVGLVTHLVHATMARVPSHVDRDDLRSAGLLALVKASQSYQPDQGASFATYATARIRGALLDELRSVDWASRSVRRKARQIEEARSRLATVLGHFPDDAEVAAALGIETGELARTVHDVARARVMSLDLQRDDVDEHRNDPRPSELVITSPELGPEARLELAERLEYLQAAIAELPDRLRAVVEGYFLDERPMATIAAELGVTESRISQMRAEALVMLRDGMNACLDPDLVKPVAASQGRPNGAVARRRDAYATAVAARQLATRQLATRQLSGRRHSPAAGSLTLAG